MVNDKHNKLVECFLDIGALLLDSGAEISRVEETISRMGAAYGAARTDVFVITSIISVTAEFAGRDSVTETRRITSEGKTFFRRLEALNSLSRECCESPLGIDELAKRINRIRDMQKRRWETMAGSMLAASSFTMFFGGNIYDAVVSGLLAFSVVMIQKELSKTRVRTMESNLLISLMLGIITAMLCSVISAIHMDKILIGDIMLLIPGIAMTNAIRNMLSGNTISGFVRLAESLMWAASIAGGIMVSLTVMNYFL